MKFQNVVGIEVTSVENEIFYDHLTVKRKRNTPVIQDFVVVTIILRHIHKKLLSWRYIEHGGSSASTSTYLDKPCAYTKAI